MSPKLFYSILDLVSQYMKGGGGGGDHMAGLAAMCWGLWKTKNYYLLNRLIRDSAEALKATVLHFHPQQAPPDDAGMVLLQ
ncbi:hypothetical protein HU200_055984 [Digitaria exilis]|uniref:Uncharacterized protein n=1 Tax=Digitaria exilis TaxID=1010633 RepID=A0A835ADS5_9POAL|nr:hypothetical protein HU200_055984 [Digitaria exilis]